MNTYALASLALGAAVVGWIGVGSAPGLYVWAVAYGFVSGLAQALFNGSLASLTPDPRKMGTRFGMVCTIVGFASLAGPPTAGAIIGQTPGGTYVWAQVWGGLVTVLAGATLLASRFAVSGARVWVKI